MTTLQALQSDRIALLAVSHSLPSTLLTALAREDDVERVRGALFSRVILEDEVREWVAELLTDFRRGETFRHEPALCALAVCLAPLPGLFAEELLSELARVGVAELLTASAIATLALERRRQRLISNADSSFRFGPPALVESPAVWEPPPLQIGETTESYTLPAA